MTEFSIDNIKVNVEERIIAKSRYYIFSRYCYWLLVKFSEEEMVYTRDLCQYAKISSSRAFNFLKDLVDLELLEQKKVSGNFSFFIPVKNGKEIKLKKYLPYFKKTLNLK